MLRKMDPNELAHVGKGERRLEAIAKVTGDAFRALVDGYSKNSCVF